MVNTLCTRIAVIVGREEMSKSRANKQNRLRAQIKRQKNDVYKFKGAGKK